MIRVNNPDFGTLEKELLIECIDTGWVSSAGPMVKRFEHELSSYVGVKHGIAVSSGTSALEVACHSIGLKPGDEVILPSFTIISSIVVLLRLGLKPVLIDSNVESWNLCTKDLEQKISDKTKALMLVHTYGLPCDMKTIKELANTHGFKIIEDCAQSLGATIEGMQTGSFGDVAAFSFFANKMITTGEGGMVVTNDDEIAEKAKGYRNLYFNNGPDKFQHLDIGYNFRMSNIQAALGVGQLSRINQIAENKILLAQNYIKLFKELPSIQLPISPEGYENVYWMFGILLPKSCKYNSMEVSHKLKEKGVDTRLFFTGMHQQNILKEFEFTKGSFPICDFLSNKGLYLPSGSNLTLKDQEYIVNSIKDIISE